MKNIVQELLKEPSLALLMQQVENHLKDEAQLRLQFYENINEQQKAEFINGEIILHSPVTLEHNFVLKRLLVLMELHVQMYSLGFIGFEKLMIHLSRNSYEPDLCFFSQEIASKFQAEQKLFPAPNLIVEILSPSTESNDRKIKFNDYEAHKINEYWIIDPYKEIIEQYILKHRKYHLVHKSKKGKINCETIPGFILETQCLFEEEKFLEMVELDKRKVFELNKIVVEKENQLIEKDNQLVEKDNQLIEKDNQLVEKDRIIEELKKIIHNDIRTNS